MMGQLQMGTQSQFAELTTETREEAFAQLVRESPAAAEHSALVSAETVHRQPLAREEQMRSERTSPRLDQGRSWWRCWTSRRGGMPEVGGELDQSWADVGQSSAICWHRACRRGPPTAAER